MAGPHPRAAHAASAGPPTQTPLRRISRGSLSALSASRSRLALDDYSQPALSHLAPVFAELSEAIEDLAVNFEGLDAINDGLDRFNEGFAGLLYGLRMNAYTSDILEAPTKRNFGHAEERAARHLQRKAEQEADAAARLAAEEDERTSNAPSSPSGSASGRGDETFDTQRGGPTARQRGGGGTGTARGRGRGRGGAAAGTASARTAQQKKKEAAIRFAAPIIATLPLQFREQQPQRSDMEGVLGALRDLAPGAATKLQDIAKLHPLVPQHRINACLIELVRAKLVVKAGSLYRLDPSRYPAGV